MIGDDLCIHCGCFEPKCECPITKSEVLGWILVVIIVGVATCLEFVSSQSESATVEKPPMQMNSVKQIQTPVTSTVMTSERCTTDD